MRKTKILVTLGPAAEEPAILRTLIDKGMNVARLNFSHGDEEEHGPRIERVKALRKEMNQPVGLLLDTKGPEIRTGPVEDFEVTLHEGTRLILTTEPCIGTAQRLSVSYPGLPERVKPGCQILLDDGLIHLQVENIPDASSVGCLVMNTGTIKGKRSVNVPGLHLDLPNPTPKDESDIRFAARQGFDFIAVSFTETPETIRNVRAILREEGQPDIKVIAKIENRIGFDHFTEILEEADGIMVARGDLGVEMAAEEVPIMQKEMIRGCYLAGKPVITATQMLHSMISSPQPTRAEVSDVANAVYDFTSAIMLSGETSVGNHPATCVETMARIAERTEGAIDYRQTYFAYSQVHPESGSPTSAITTAAITTAYKVGATAIITVTESGRTARHLSRLRPEVPIIAIVSNERLFNQLAINWGVVPLLGPKFHNLDQVHHYSVALAQSTGLVKAGDLVILVAGVPVGKTGATNLIKIERVGSNGTEVMTDDEIGPVKPATIIPLSHDSIPGRFRRNPLAIISRRAS